MTLKIVCPNCNFSRTIPRERVPPGVRWATCPRCRQRFELSLEGPAFDPGAEGTATEREPETGRRASPWEKRSELGLWGASWESLKGVMFSPERFFREMSYQDGLREPLAFGLLFGSLGTILGIFWQFLVMSGTLMILGRNFIGDLGIGLVAFAVMIICPVMVLAGLFFTGAVLHLCLIITGAGRHGFEATFRVVSFSQATQILGLVPFVGGAIGWVWQLIISLIGLKEIHETTYGRVVLALLIPLGVVMLSAAAALILVFLVL